MDTDREVSTWSFDAVAKMKAKGREITPQHKHPGSHSGQNWQPDEQTRRNLGDALSITKEIIEEP